MTTQVMDMDFSDGDDEDDNPMVEVLDDEGDVDDTIPLILDPADAPKWNFSIGRNSSADVTLDDPSVSLNHATILIERKSDGGLKARVYITEGTTNPSKMTGVPKMKPGQKYGVPSKAVLTLGARRIRIHLPKPPGEGAPSIGPSSVPSSTNGMAEATQAHASASVMDAAAPEASEAIEAGPEVEEEVDHLATQVTCEWCGGIPYVARTPPPTHSADC
jgi:hypothetical protein